MRSSGSLGLALLLGPLRASFAMAAPLIEKTSARLKWQPLDHYVTVSIDDSDDANLKAVDLHGVVRGWQPDSERMLLVELHRTLVYRGKFDDDIRWLVATPCLKWHGSATLPLVNKRLAVVLAVLAWTHIAQANDWSAGVTYRYDGAGNIKQIGTDSHVYDWAGRIIQSDTNGVCPNLTGKVDIVYVH